MIVSLKIFAILGGLVMEILFGSFRSVISDFEMPDQDSLIRTLGIVSGVDMNMGWITETSAIT